MSRKRPGANSDRALLDGSGFASKEKAEDEQEKNRAHHRRDEAYWLTFRVPSRRAAKKACNEGAGDADEHGNYDPARIISGKEELGDDAYQEADHKHDEYGHGGHRPAPKEVVRGGFRKIGKDFEEAGG